MSDPAKVSVIIPALNEQANIEDCLAHLCSQTLSSASFEVLVIDNGSSDETVVRARRFQEQLPLRIMELPRCTISDLRNQGATAASGAVLAFLDADCMAEPNWLERLLAHRQENTIWGAHYKIQRDASWVGRIWFRYQATEQSGPVSFLPGGCLITTRAVFEALGGFNIEVHTSEDVDLCARARRAGVGVFAYPDLAVYHEGTPRTLTRFWRQNRWHGKHVMRMFLAELPSTRNLPLVLATFYTFVMFWAAWITPAFMLPRHSSLAFLPLALLLLLPVLLASAKVIRSRSFSDIPPLALLYLVYLLARASALIHMPERGRR